MSCVACIVKLCEYYCEISPELVDADYNTSNNRRYKYCRHTCLINPIDIFKEIVDNYDINRKDIQLQLGSASNEVKKWYNFISFGDYTDEDKQKNLIRFQMRANYVTVSVSLAALSPHTCDKLMKFRINTAQILTIEQLKQKLAIEYMFAAESVSLYLSDTNKHFTNRQLLDDMAVKNAWFYPHFNRSVIHIIPNCGVK
ncbi:uncharacterized protein LOC128963374 [Oppia nitens]|uniref:uncharacterized protein LOC128963374 n=1 Tax=Oppia nitens TaxID=1686743 RepID=UPI0023DCCB9E|nr:uncharacterized protein LOC128963374 [Oppia nitens]